MLHVISMYDHCINYSISCIVTFCKSGFLMTCKFKGPEEWSIFLSFFQSTTVSTFFICLFHKAARHCYGMKHGNAYAPTWSNAQFVTEQVQNFKASLRSILSAFDSMKKAPIVRCAQKAKPFLNIAEKTAH